MAVSRWEIRKLRLKPDLLLEMALSSLKVRLSRTYLTLLTIATATAFLIYLMTVPRSEDVTEQQIWLLMMVLSVLVAAAGVLNTMLMNVTQRYREIGTLKCLGALDSFVLWSVLLESAILGLIGAFGGVLAGLVLAVVFALFGHGGDFLDYLRFEGWYWKIALTLLIGLSLTTFGAAVPAFLAAKMPPIEAMRGEK